MGHSADDFAMLSDEHMITASKSASPEQRRMYLAIAHHYAQIAILKGRCQTNVLELRQSEARTASL
jgi:hypothetical protein